MQTGSEGPTTTGDGDGDSSGDGDGEGDGDGDGEPTGDGDGEPTGDGDGEPGPVCGNGVIESGELCDTGDLGGESCQTQGFASGGLTCLADCSGFDTSTCSSCGDGVLDDGEQCDGSELGASATCFDLGLGTADEALACKADCTYDFINCSGCGDGMITPPEQCEPAGPMLDKDELGDATCQSIGFDDGLLSCSAGCTFNTDGCYNCGDAVQQGNEQCDGADFANLTCADFLSPSNQPFAAGSLTCTNDCTIDTGNCSLCGDGVISGAEICEPGVLAGQTCGSQGFDGGVLGCLADCSGFDTSACTDCGDGLVEGNEQCDGNNLAGSSCQSLGFPGGGTLTCTNTCQFNTAQCSNEFCGDGIRNANEQCDCGNQGVNCTNAQLGNQNCQTQGFDGGALSCFSPNNCMYNTSGCYSCGDGVINPGESCDGNNLGGQTCVGLGFPGGGTLACNQQCGFDVAQCINVSNPYTICASPNTPIPSSGWGTASVINIPAGGTVTDVNVSITALHTWVGDLAWTLTKGGTSRVLINRVTNGSGNCSGDNINVVLDDEGGGGSVQGQCAINPAIASPPSRIPNQALSAFDNTSMVGSWTLQPNDLAAGDSGTFQQWCLTITWQ
jgi:hypothetical protein